MNLTNKILIWNGILGIIHSNFKKIQFYFHIPKFSKPQQTKIEVTIFGSVIPKNPRRVINPRNEIPICPFTHGLVYLQDSKPHKTNQPKIQTFFTNPPKKLGNWFENQSGIEERERVLLVEEIGGERATSEARTMSCLCF